MLKKYSISPNSISMVHRIGRNNDSMNVSQQSSLTGYITDISASSSDDEEAARKKVLLKNKINEVKQDIIREESNYKEETLEDEKELATAKNDHIACPSSILSVDKDGYSFDYSESSQQSMADGNEEKPDKVMFDNNIKVKDENDIVTVDSINDANMQIRNNNEDLEENVNYDSLKHEEKVALIEQQYNVALCTVNKIEEHITTYSKQLENMKSNSSPDNLTGESLDLENREALQNAMKVFGTKIMDNQGSNLLRHLHDMHQNHPETIQSNALSLDESAAKAKAMNMHMEYRKLGNECPHCTAGHPSRTLDDNDEEIQDNGTNSSESLNEVEVWSKDLNKILKYVDRRDLPILRKFAKCPVNEDGNKVLRLNSLFIAIAHPVTLKYRVVYDPIRNSDEAQQPQNDDASNLVTHKHKYMSLVQHEDILEAEDKETETYYTNEDKWESCTNETESLTNGNDANVTDDEDSDWKTVDLEEIDENSLANTEDSHQEYVNQQNQYNLMSRASLYPVKRRKPAVEFCVTMRNQHKEDLVREYVAYRNDKNLVDKSTSYSSLPAQDAMELLYKNQDAKSEESTSVTARLDDNEISMTFRNINDDVEHMINDLLIDVSEIKDECMEITEGMCVEPMVELKQTSNGVTSCIDTTSRISEALAQTILHEILEDVFYYSEEHVASEAGTDDTEILHCEPDIAEAEINDDKCEDPLEGLFTYMRKDDRSKVFRSLDEVMQDLADDTIMDQRKLNTEMGEESSEYCTCPSSMEEPNSQRDYDEKLRLIHVKHVLHHMLQREANKRHNRDVPGSKRAHATTSDHLCNDSSARKSSPTCADHGSGANERKGIITDNSPVACNYHRFFNNNFSIKSGFIGTGNNAVCNTCSHLVGMADSGRESAHFKTTNDNATDCDLLRHAEKQQSTKYRKSESYQQIELPKYSRTSKRKNSLMVDTSVGNDSDMTESVSSKTDSSVDKNEVEQNIEENLWSFEEAMRNLIRVNTKTAKLLKSTCVFSTAGKSVDKPCCSDKRTENTSSELKKSVTKNVTGSDKSLTKLDQSLTDTDQSLTKGNQHMSDDLEEILTNFSHQFTECQEPSNLK